MLLLLRSRLCLETSLGRSVRLEQSRLARSPDWVRVTYFGPHLGDNYRNVLMSDLHLGRNKLGIDDVLSEQDEGISRAGNMVFRALWELRVVNRYWQRDRDLDLPFSHATFCHCL